MESHASPTKPSSSTPSTPTEPKSPQHEQGKFGPASALAVTFLAYLGSQVAAVLILFGVYSLVTRQNSDQVINRFSETTVGQFMFLLLAQATTLAIIFWFVRRRKVTLHEIGLGRLPKLGDLGYGTIFALGYFITAVIVLALVENFIPSINVKQEQQIGFESAAGPGALALVFLALAVVVPITEEIMIRGFLYSGLRRKLTRVASALIASFLFGIAHLQFGSGAPLLYVVGIDTFILSLFLIALREKTGSLWAGIAVHALKNGIAFMALFVLDVA